MSSDRTSSRSDRAGDGAGGRPDFVTFRDRLVRLVESLVNLRHLPDVPGLSNEGERAEVMLESDAVIVTFSVARLPWKTVNQLVYAFSKAFGGFTPLLAEPQFSDRLRFAATRRNRNRFVELLSDERISMTFKRTLIRERETLEVRANLVDFNDHFEVFVTEAARVLFPPIEAPTRCRALDLESWHKEFGRSFEQYGCRVMRETDLGWKDLAGLERVRQQLERAVLLPLTREALYQKVARAVMPGGVNVLPRGVLLTGPPGTGKTWSMRALAGEAGLPVVALPCEALMTKWYGESERRLADVFSLCRCAGRMILFIDELDALARHRKDSHEATARLVSILLAEMDGFAGRPDVLLVGSANDVSSIDVAVLDRFDVTIPFDVPDAGQRRQALAYYARQLPADEVAQLADRMDGWTFRQLARFAETVVRAYVSGLDLSQLEAREPPIPRMEDYVRELSVSVSSAPVHG